MRSRRRCCRRTGIDCRFPAGKIPHLSLRQELGFERCRGRGVRIVMSSGVVIAAATLRLCCGYRGSSVVRCVVGFAHDLVDERGARLG